PPIRRACTGGPSGDERFDLLGDGARDEHVSRSTRRKRRRRPGPTLGGSLPRRRRASRPLGVVPSSAAASTDVRRGFSTLLAGALAPRASTARAAAMRSWTSSGARQAEQ